MDDFSFAARLYPIVFRVNIHEVVRFTESGLVEIPDRVAPDEAARAFVRIVTDTFPQVTHAAELAALRKVAEAAERWRDCPCGGGAGCQHTHDLLDALEAWRATR